MGKNSLKSPELYINRELSWLEFNDRVLREGLSSEVPLMERVKFLAIVLSNLDEFFLVRVAGLMRQRAAGISRRDPAGLTPKEQLSAIAARVRRMLDEHAQGVREALEQLAQHGLRVLRPAQWTPAQRRVLESRFAEEILPVLTPLAIEELSPRPLLPSLQLFVAALIAPAAPIAEWGSPAAETVGLAYDNASVDGAGGPVDRASGSVGHSDLASGSPSVASDFPDGSGGESSTFEMQRQARSEDPAQSKVQQPTARLVVVPVPTQCPRFLSLPGESEVCLVRMEDVIAAGCGLLFPASSVKGTAVFRITRDADVSVDAEDAEDLLREMEEAVLQRRRRAAVRLTISANAHQRIKNWLKDWLGLREEEVYEIDGFQDAAALWELAAQPGFDKLRNADWPPQRPRDLIGWDDLWEAVQDHDVLLFHPYESFDPIVELLEQAAADPNVLAIKQTLYRTSGDSPVVRALQRAAQQGKEVTVLVELRARFDEARNIAWARRLEDAGCHVIYGVAGLKTHAKALLIVRRQGSRIARYVHLSTGNYNERTARLYSDIGLLTCNRDIATDVAAFFNLLTGCSEAVGWRTLSVAPAGLKQRFLDLIDREIQVSTADKPGLIMAKVNSLQDPDMVRALYRASQAGVKVMLNVRGICCLRPGIKGVSENIEVRSIVDRFLEHARIFYFHNGGHEEVYLSSADWMRRNLERRLEILFPVPDPRHRRRLIDILHTFFADNQKARLLQPDGSYVPAPRKGPKVRAQEVFFRQAVAEARETEKAAAEFQPLIKPKD
jgi:polyphosphate kinase